MRPVTFLRSSAVLLMASVLLTALPQGAVIGQATGGVRVGEPLHIYLRKDVAQQLLYLHFYPPPGDVPLTEATSRFALDRKGSLNATVVTFFPRDMGSNFLQFEPNASVEAKYQLMLFASRPLNVSDNKARLELIIELDYQNDNEYDERFVATVRFNATSSFVKVQGSLPMDPEELRRFDGKKGGKVRMTLARADDLDTIVVVHCGSSAEPSFVQLPFSKYRYEVPFFIALRR